MFEQTRNSALPLASLAIERRQPLQYIDAKASPVSHSGANKHAANQRASAMRMMRLVAD